MAVLIELKIDKTKREHKTSTCISEATTFKHLKHKKLITKEKKKNIRSNWLYCVNKNKYVNR
jgi:hypothetical protein